MRASRAQRRGDDHKVLHAEYELGRRNRHGIERIAPATAERGEKASLPQQLDGHLRCEGAVGRTKAGERNCRTIGAVAVDFTSAVPGGGNGVRVAVRCPPRSIVTSSGILPLPNRICKNADNRSYVNYIHLHTETIPSSQARLCRHPRSAPSGRSRGSGGPRRAASARARCPARAAERPRRARPI